MGCGCGGNSNRYDATAAQRQERQTRGVDAPPATAATGLPKVFTGRRGQPVNGPKPK